MKFSGLYGLHASASVLQRALERDTVSGSYLFTGPEGVGKTALATAFAQTLACTSPAADPVDACGSCNSCRLMESGTHPEVALISPAGEATQLWQFWDRDNRPPGILQHALPYAPVVGRRRVFIIERADTLTEPAANSLLKVIEEPPPYVNFVLLAPNASRLLPTILSRCQQVRVAPARPEALAEWLAAEKGVDLKRAHEIAGLCEGRIGAACQLVSNEKVSEELALFRDWIVELSSAAPLQVLKLAEMLRRTAAGLKGLLNIAPKAETPDTETESGTKERVGRRHLGAALEVLSSYYRDVLQLAAAGDSAVIVHEPDRAKLLRVAHTDSPDRWMRCLEALLAARRQLEQNASIQLVTDTLVLGLHSV
jgi:DNA polymerase-3 subunit delta'